MEKELKISSEILNYFNGDQLAASSWVKKYALKDENGNLIEKTPDDMHKRMAKEFARIESKYEWKQASPAFNLSNYGYNRFPLSEEEIYDLFAHFKYIIPAGSVMYGLENPKPVSLSNCFVIDSPKDSITGIFKTCSEQASLFKRRGGVGFDISTLRPNQAKVNNSAHYSTGSVSFMDLFSQVTNTIGEHNRRGALMISISVNHPDIFEFITKKQDLTKVTGANVSVKITDEFMQAVENDEDYLLRFPIDLDIHSCRDKDYSFYEYNKLYCINEKENIYIKRIKAKELWNTLIHCAWNTAEPGIIFEDAMINYAPDGVYPPFKMISTNPCVTYDTTLLTPEGFVKIGDVCDKNITIWNGWEWSNVKPFKTSDSAEVFKVKFSDGSELDCTSYHKFILSNKERKELKDLKIGDKLIKWNLPTPNIEDNISENKLKNAYTQGFWQGDGTTDNRENRTISHTICLYDKKIALKDRFNGIIRKQEIKDNYKQYIDVTNIVNGLKNYIPFDLSHKEKLYWLSGLIDSDGTLNEESGCISISSIDKHFLLQIKKMLILLGINSKVVDMHKAKKALIKGQECNCQDSFRLLISASKVKKLNDLGLITYRVPSNPNPQRDSEHFIKIVSIESIGYQATYCLTDEKNNSCLFNDIVTSQCAEIAMEPYNSCRLMHINLTSVVENPFTKDAKLNDELLYKLSYEALVLGDDLIDLEIEAVNNIIEVIKEKGDKEELELWENINNEAIKTRRCGIGFTAQSDMIAMLGEKYGSDKSLQIIENVMRIMFLAQLDATIDLAIKRGKFEGYDKELELKGNDWYNFIKNNFPTHYNKMMQFGRRNLSFSTVAPTGTVSLMAQTSTGIEPLFMPYYIRKVKCMSNTDRVDSTDVVGLNYTHFVVVHPTLRKWIEAQDNGVIVDLLSPEEMDVWFKKSPWYQATAPEISWKKRIEIQSICQKYTTHSISSTINLPKETTEQEIADIYFQAWKFKNKGQTVYRDGCRDGVLVNIKNEKPKEIIDSKAPKRPKELEAEYHEIKSKGRRFAIIVGLYDNKPYEIFAFELDNEQPILKQHKGKNIKIGKMHYRFVSEFTTIKNLQLRNENVEEKAATLYASMLLRHGVSIKYIVKTAKKVNENITSFTSAICRVLSKYMENETIQGEVCPECGSKLIREGGCIRCSECSYSKCL